MGLVLTYCEKCGQMTDIGFDSEEDRQNKPCIGCLKTGFVKVVPKEYLDEDGDFMNEEVEKDFIENVIKVSPNFEQWEWDDRERYQAERRRQEMYEASFAGKSKGIACTYCGSTNVSKIGFLSRLGSAELWGLGSDKIGKQFHCNNCGANF